MPAGTFPTATLSCRPPPYPANCRPILPTAALFCQPPPYPTNCRPGFERAKPRAQANAGLGAGQVVTALQDSISRSDPTLLVRTASLVLAEGLIRSYTLLTNTTNVLHPTPSTCLGHCPARLHLSGRPHPFGTHRLPIVCEPTSLQGYLRNSPPP